MATSVSDIRHPSEARTVKKVMRHDSSIEVSPRADACRQFAHQPFAADIELGTEAHFLCPDEAVRRENAPRTRQVRALKSLRRKGSASISIPLWLSAPSVRRTHLDSDCGQAASGV